jgi:5-methylcytosine-specific restriction endonuclease McrA
MKIKGKQYPLNWRDVIRPAVLKRADYKCEICKAPNHTHIRRLQQNLWIEADEFDLIQRQKGDKAVQYIILSISHSNHDINNNELSNLRALCQRCHLNHDRAYHIMQKLINRAKQQ